MATNTARLGLIKPDPTDKYSLTDYNANLDTLDSTAPAVQTLTDDGTTVTWDAAQGNCAAVTLGANLAISLPTNLIAGRRYVLQITQDAVGGWTLTFGTGYQFASGTAPVLTTTAGAVDILDFICYDAAALMCVGVVQDIK